MNKLTKEQCNYYLGRLHKSHADHLPYSPADVIDEIYQAGYEQGIQSERELNQTVREALEE